MTTALNQYLASLTPKQHDRALVASRRNLVKGILDDAGMSVVSMFESGSWSHGTGISQKSDVDYMVWLSYTNRTERPSSILRRVKEALFDAETSDFGIPQVSLPTVRVPFYSPPDFEIVPAIYDSGELTAEGVFEIPGQRDEWILTSPGAHNRYVTDTNQVLHGRLKLLIRLIKAWKYANEVPLSSFYLEMRTTRFMQGAGWIVLDLDLRETMEYLLTKNVADMVDPTGHVGRIPACPSEDAQITAKHKLHLAVAALNEAADKAEAEDWLGYCLSMSRVFGPEFPYAEG